PGRRASAQQVVAQAFLAAPKPGAEPRDSRQVSEDHPEIQVARGGHVATSSIPLICYDLGCGTRTPKAVSKKVAARKRFGYTPQSYRYHGLQIGRIMGEDQHLI